MPAEVIQPMDLLRGMFAASLQVVSPQNTIPQALASLQPTSGRTLVLCIGKAAAQMAEVAEGILLNTIGAEKFSGVVVTKHGNQLPLKHLKTMTAGHPDADEHSVAAAEHLLKEAATLTPNDRMLVLMSGGASALTLLPADGLSFRDVTKVNKELLRGVPIGDMNIVRRHMSRFNGGRLARAANGAEIITFAVSDVPGDVPAIIGSGPTAEDASTFADAQRVVTQYGLDVPKRVARHLEAAVDESVKPGDELWRKKYQFKVIASNSHAVKAAAAHALAHGVTPIIIDEPIAGDAAAEAKLFADIAKSGEYKGQKISGPAVLIRGGEAVVKTPKGTKKVPGGRVGHAALSHLIEDENCFAFFGATDGSDGTSGHKAIELTPDTMKQAKAKGLDPVEHLRAYRSAAFFNKAGGAVHESPTGTNVNEIYMRYIPA